MNKTINKIYLFLALGLLISGCGEFSYKRGASVGELETTKQACKSVGNDAAIEKCMEEHGWVVQKLEAIDLFATPSTNDDNRRVPTNEDIKAAEVKEKTSSANAQIATSSETKPEAKPKPSSLDTFMVSSWWKIGASGDALRIDTDACVAELGEEHRPVVKTQRATRGFALCMRAKGWKGLLAK